MSEQPKARPLVAMEASARQLMLMAGMGFLGLVAGAMLTSSLISRLNDRVEITEGGVLNVVLGLVLPNLWALLVIPGLGWLTLRFLELNPGTFALVSCGTAFLFRLALDFVTGGAELILANPRQIVWQLVVLAVAITLTWLAARRGQVYAQAQAAVAAQQAQKAKQQYAQFAEQAKAMAERREALPISAPQASPTSDAAAAVGVPPTVEAAPAVEAPAAPTAKS